MLPGVDISGCLSLFAGILVVCISGNSTGNSTEIYRVTVYYSYSYTVMLHVQTQKSEAPKHKPHQALKMVLNCNQDDRSVSLMSLVLAYVRIRLASTSLISEQNLNP